MYTLPEEALCSGAAVSHHTPPLFKDNYPSSSPLSTVSPLAGSPVITALLEAGHPRKHRPFWALIENALPFPSRSAARRIRSSPGPAPALLGGWPVREAGGGAYARYT